MINKKKEFHPIIPIRMSRNNFERLRKLKEGKGTWEYFFLILNKNSEKINLMFKKKYDKKMETKE